MADLPVANFASPPDRPPLLRVERLRKEFPQWQEGFGRAAPLVAVDDVSFELGAGETLGLVGESGCGKSTAARLILRLIPATAGQVIFDGQDVLTASRPVMRRLRRAMQIVFQDPAGSLNPRMTVGAIIAEPMLIHRFSPRRELHDRVAWLLERCGLPGEAARRYPHEFSGGQKQRIGIARALALQPRLIICDEPTSALDVSVQAQILNLLRDLQRDQDLSLLFISHDMAVVNQMCERVAMMRRGRIVELGPRSQVIDDPQHPYTRQLLRAVPRIGAAG